jgi:hypothetical protein
MTTTQIILMGLGLTIVLAPIAYALHFGFIVGVIQGTGIAIFLLTLASL